MMGNNDKIIEERTEARAEAFRAQERVRELEALVVRRYDVRTIGEASQLDVDLYNEGERIATKRREGK